MARADWRVHGECQWRQTAQRLNSVIASQRVGAKRRPTTGSAKQSSFIAAKLDCFVASLLAMTVAEIPALLRKLLLDKRGNKARHCRGEIGGPTHQMDRGEFGLLLPAEICLDPFAQRFA